jgi:hypothetical protein
MSADLIARVLNDSPHGLDIETTEEYTTFEDDDYYIKVRHDSRLRYTLKTPDFVVTAANMRIDECAGFTRNYIFYDGQGFMNMDLDAEVIPESIESVIEILVDAQPQYQAR